MLFYGISLKDVYCLQLEQLYFFTFSYIYIYIYIYITSPQLFNNVNLCFILSHFHSLKFFI